MLFTKKIKIEEKKKRDKEEVLPSIKEGGWLETEGQLAVDVYETDSDWVVKAPVAGVSINDLDVSVEKDMLVIKGARQDAKEIQKKNYFYQECFWGSFSRKILLPDDIDPNRTEASMEKGVLTVKIPKIQIKEKRKIAIKE